VSAKIQFVSKSIGIWTFASSNLEAFERPSTTSLDYQVRAGHCRELNCQIEITIFAFNSINAK
jgi:hypothetical protein